ncbi:GFA family protein [Inquilinus limosus]|uniref:GFA family protein n=1 Tax=Inquilinus limosus TaxID=171674 RepID=UPI003F168181
MKTPITGRCFCGAVRFRFDQPPVATRACWCRDCQYLSSGNASINAIFRTESLTLTGEVAEYVSTADSGNVMYRRFCPRCGTPLFSQASDRPDMIVVRAGALDDPEIARPASVIWTASAPSWGHVDPDLPSRPDQPGPVSGS